MSWRDGNEWVPANSSRARKLRRKFHRKKEIVVTSIDGREYVGDDKTRLLSSMARLKTLYTEPTFTMIGRALGPLAAGVDLQYNELPDLLFMLEDEAIHRMGNRTYFDPAALEEKVDEFGRVEYNPTGSVLDIATAKVAERLAHVRFKPLDYVTSLEVMLTREKSTSAGFPWISSRSAVAYHYLPTFWRELNPDLDAQALSKHRRLGIQVEPIDDAKASSTGEPTYLANFRTEAGADGEHKTRLVWSAPLGRQIYESRYAIPFQELMKNEDPGADHMNGEMFVYFSEYRQMQVMRNLIGYAQNYGRTLVSADYSAFDATISADLIKRAFGCIGLNHVSDGFIHKKLLTPWGSRRYSHGVPSGSPFTNIIDSVVNAIILEYIAAGAGTECVYRVNGDDSVVVFDDDIQGTEIASRALELGITMNPSKQARSKDSCTFNRQYWGLEYTGPVPSINRTLNSLIYRDKPYEAVGKTLVDECLRDTQILIRLESHPFASEFLSKIVRILGDKSYLLDYRTLLSGDDRMLPVQGGTPISSEEYVKFLDTTFLSEIYK